jgi:hypothetical protein
MTAGTPDLDRPTGPDGRQALTPDAERALDEARARTAGAAKGPAALPHEKGGRDGPEPVRYGDWESKGRAVDF